MFVRTLDDVIAAGRLRELQTGDTRSARYLTAAVRIVHPTHMLFYFQVGGYESARPSAAWSCGRNGWCRWWSRRSGR